MANLTLAILITMRFQIDNKEFKVSFNYPKGKSGGHTTCTISMGETNSQDSEKIELVSVKVRKDTREADNLVYARTAALIKGLNASDIPSTLKTKVLHGIPIRILGTAVYESKPNFNV